MPITASTQEHVTQEWTSALSLPARLGGLLSFSFNIQSYRFEHFVFIKVFYSGVKEKKKKTRLFFDSFFFLCVCVSSRRCSTCSTPISLINKARKWRTGWHRLTKVLTDLLLLLYSAVLRRSGEKKMLRKALTPLKTAFLFLHLQIHLVVLRSCWNGARSTRQATRPWK